MGIFTRVCYNEHNEITVVWLKSWNGRNHVQYASLDQNT